jgi:hypothetical protein
MEELYYYLATIFLFSRTKIGGLIFIILLTCGLLVKNLSG